MERLNDEVLIRECRLKDALDAQKYYRSAEEVEFWMSTTDAKLESREPGKVTIIHHHIKKIVPLQRTVPDLREFYCQKRPQLFFYHSGFSVIANNANTIFLKLVPYQETWRPCQETWPPCRHHGMIMAMFLPRPWHGGLIFPTWVAIKTKTFLKISHFIFADFVIPQSKPIFFSIILKDKNFHSDFHYQNVNITASEVSDLYKSK